LHGLLQLAPPALRPTMRQTIAHLPLEEPTCVCDECLMAFWKNVCMPLLRKPV
jgi:hypothetical protein